MSLNAIHAVDPTLCPASHAHGALADSQGYFLVTEFLDLTGSRFSPSVANRSLAEKLAKLHVAPVPGVSDESAKRFGFPVPTACGSTMQDNTWSNSWAEFYANRRLRVIIQQAERRNGNDEDLARWVERIASKVVPRLLGDGHLGGLAALSPAIVHGDLWSGNKGIEAGGEPVVFDPSGCYAHHEYDHGIMHMFGGFPRGFWKEYHEIIPKTEPANEWEDRVSLYELYHHLNHYSMFGCGYKSGAMGIILDLWGKYGREEAA